MIDVSTGIAFLVGVATGAAGTYFADKYTDRRRAYEAEHSAKQKFKSMSELMPELLEEMRIDMANDGSGVVREFVVLPNECVIFNTSRQRFVYYENAHRNLRDKLDRLEEAAFIINITEKDTPIYKWSEDFVSLLMHS